MGELVDVRKAKAWKACATQCVPYGKAKALHTTDKLYRQCYRCGRWVEVDSLG